MENVLIIGEHGYLATKQRDWLRQYPSKYIVDVASARNNQWEKIDFRKYDVIINYAGIAHINKITDDMRDLFYSVNGLLPADIAKKAKEQGVSLFIHFSSMNVYGDYSGVVCDRSAVAPGGFYGDSKLQGDIGLEALEDSAFTIAHIRPPFVYGRNCSGNYNTISKIAKVTPVFPDFDNKKSMIYIDNLCEFIRMVIDNHLGGYLTPQNKELVSTSKLVKEIAHVNGKKVLFTKAFTPFIFAGRKLSGQLKRAFSDDAYDPSLSDYFNWEYCIVGFAESIRRTEIK